MAMVSALGSGREQSLATLKRGIPQLSRTHQYSESKVLLGLCQASLPEIELSEPWWHSRNNRLAQAALNQISDEIASAIDRFGAHRIGVVIGTSTSGISDSEESIRQLVATGQLPDQFDYRFQEMGATAAYVARSCRVTAPVYAVSTACSSGAKALASARRLIRSGLCDAVIAGGVDTLCQLTVQGFTSLEAVSSEQCNPFSANRNGINIGEAAALFLVSDEPQGVELVGVGESSDAYHISAPDPTGEGAMRCMTAALKDAGISASQVGYINLHGTATVLNDQMESRAVSRVFGAATSCSSTKPFTGHTLGAAGALEAAISWLALEHQFYPLHLWDGERDSELPMINLALTQTEVAPIDYVLSNSFAFGGNNISLILRKVT